MTMEASESCSVCGAAATRLCDFVLGFSIGGYVKCTGEHAYQIGRFAEYDRQARGLPFAGDKMFTCDRALCDQCTQRVGMTTVRGTPDQIDHCPVHAGKQHRFRCLTDEQVDQLRELHKRPANEPEI